VHHRGCAGQRNESGDRCDYEDPDLHEDVVGQQNAATIHMMGNKTPFVALRPAATAPTSTHDREHEE
jgi:hypothetical protein